jgi:hypothetical protein
MILQKAGIIVVSVIFGDFNQFWGEKIAKFIEKQCYDYFFVHKLQCL